MTVEEILNYREPATGWRLFPLPADLIRMDWEEHEEWHVWRERSLDCLAELYPESYRLALGLPAFVVSCGDEIPF
jgi:hypothetical protein